MTTKIDEVPKRVEEALFFRLKQRGFEECDDRAKHYADCCRGRILSMAWACRAEAKEFSNCMSKYTGKIGTMKAMWIARGAKHKMTEAEWDILLNDVIASD
ncbi:hypothetical protein Ndes2526B_g05355 [Nannochloris sp. 'desiccata']|nr:hypothetical protein KSW81_006294 [Chlorella desiccata (nom. nud.)]